MRWVWCVALVLPLVSGCYLWHGGDEALAPTRDAGIAVRDAAPATADAGSPPPRDAGSPTLRDGAMFFADAAPLPDDEPDVAPDERPSDDPSSGEWMDPPPDTSSACCEVGELIGLDDPTRQASPPVVAFDGAEWGVAWSDTSAPTFGGDPRRALFRRLDVEARPTLETRVLADEAPTLADLAWGNSRFGLATSTFVGFRDYREGWLWVLDREGGVRSGLALPDGLGGDAIVRHPLVHGWAIAARGPEVEGSITTAELVVVRDDMSVLARRELGVIGDGDSSRADVVSMKSRLAVAIGRPEGTQIQTFATAAIERTDVTEIGPIGIELAATPFRDRMILAGRSYERSPLRVAIWDPFTLEVVTAPTEVARTASGQGLAIAADDVGGTVGLCYPTGGSPSRDADALTFVLLGPDGTRLGEPVTVASGLRYVAACAVASAGVDRYVVVMWNAAWDAPRHSILAASVRVRR